MADPAKRPRVLIVGFGETGVLVATRLPKRFDVIAVSTKPCLVSGQELGARLTAPEDWKRDYVTDFRRFRGLDGVTIVEGRVLSLDPARQRLEIEKPDGTRQQLEYDILVIASGITNGFWRNDAFRDRAAIESEIAANAARLAQAETIAVVGGGPSGVSAAANLAVTYPAKAVHLFHSGDLPLPGYHPKTRADIVALLREKGVDVHAQHRAVLPVELQAIGAGEIAWESGQTPFAADAVIWAVGAAYPNTGFLPPEMLDDEGYVPTDAMLRVPGHASIFAIGDVAATDPNRSSARNWAYRILAHNIRAAIQGDPNAMKPFTAPEHRWGSIVGLQRDGLTIYQQGGKMTRLSRWVVQKLLFPIAVRRMIYRGVRRR